MLATFGTALVTGGGSGLGRATARHLAANGCRVAVLDRDGAAAQAVADEIGGLGLACDVAEEASVAAAFAEVQAVFGSAPRIAVSCAGIGTAGRILPREGALPIAAFDRTLRVNLLGTYIVLSHAAQAMAGLKPMPDGARGVIINTASVAWQDGQIGQAAYAASKGGVAALTLPAAREFARLGIRVMTIAPGLFETPMTAGLPEDARAAITATIPFPARLGAPEDFALLVGQIALNPYLNGEVIRLDAAVRLAPR